MQITLNQEEIHAAVEQYVRGQINISANQSLSIDFTAGRGPNGISATLDIRPAAMAAAPSKPVVRAVETPAEDPAEEAEPEVETVDEAPETEDSAPEADDSTADEDTPTEEESKPARSGKSIFSKAS